MQKIKDNKYWILLTIILIVIILIREGCNNNEKNRLVQNIISYSDTAKYERLKNGALISTNTSLKLSSEKQIKELAANINETVEQMVKKYKLLSSVTYLTNNYYKAGDTIKTGDSIPCDFKPYKVAKKDSTYEFEGTIAKNYFSIDKLSVPNKLTIISGKKKVGFMRYDDVVSVNNSNPLMITSNITDYRYAPKKKWYQKTWVHMMEGAFFQTGIHLGINYLKNNSL
jgi:hypothetical protein